MNEHNLKSVNVKVVEVTAVMGEKDKEQNPIPAVLYSI